LAVIGASTARPPRSSVSSLHATDLGKAGRIEQQDRAPSSAKVVPA
jgi:hypothetical protein